MRRAALAAVILIMCAAAAPALAEDMAQADSPPSSAPSPAPASTQPAPDWQLGADVSSLPQVQAAGGIFRDRGKPADLLAILKSHGFNCIRLRVWNHPKDGWCDLPHTLAMAARVQRAGLRLLIDFHYSDNWADPARQAKPAAWQNLHGPALQNAVYIFTRDAIAALDAQGTPPDMVQIGNEITNGMLWDDGRLYPKPPPTTQPATQPTTAPPATSPASKQPPTTHSTAARAAIADPASRWRAFAALLRAARAGVSAARPNGPPIRVIIHIDKGGSNAACRWFFDHLIAEKVDFDIIGLSYYPFWQGGLANLSANLRDLPTRYHKDILILETGYPTSPAGVNPKWKNRLPFPPTVAGQREFLSRLLSTVEATPDHRAIGIYYWEPAWLPTKKAPSTWANKGLFDPDGNLLESIDALTGK